MTSFYSTDYIIFIAHTIQFCLLSIETVFTLLLHELCAQYTPSTSPCVSIHTPHTMVMAKPYKCQASTHNTTPLRPGFALNRTHSVDPGVANDKWQHTQQSTSQTGLQSNPKQLSRPSTGQSSTQQNNSPTFLPPPPPPLWSATQTRTTYGSLRGMPACGQAMGCGVCDTPELWRGATGLCARVCACAGAAESAYTYIHTLQPGSPLTLTHAARVKGSGVTRSLRARPPCIRMHSIYTYIYTCMHIWMDESVDPRG